MMRRTHGNIYYFLDAIALLPSGYTKAVRRRAGLSCNMIRRVGRTSALIHTVKLSVVCGQNKAG